MSNWHKYLEIAAVAAVTIAVVFYVPPLRSIVANNA